MAVPGAVKNQRGLTLIEALVSAVIMALLIGVSFSLFMIYTREIREGVAMTRLQMHYESIAGTAASLTRNGAAVVKTSESAWPVPLTWIADSADAVFFKDRNGNVTGGLRTAGGYLQEYLPDDGTWINYRAGNYEVAVAAGPKPFFLNAGRNTLTITMALRTANMGTPYSLASRGDEFK